MTDYRVPVRYEVDAYALVEAESPEEAAQKTVDGDFIDLYGYNDSELEIAGDVTEWGES